MDCKYDVLVVNDVFRNENIMVVKSSGSQSVIRYDEEITKEEVEKYLDKNGIQQEKCRVTVVDKDWKGNTQANTY